MSSAGSRFFIGVNPLAPSFLDTSEPPGFGEITREDFFDPKHPLIWIEVPFLEVLDGGQSNEITAKFLYYEEVLPEGQSMLRKAVQVPAPHACFFRVEFDDAPHPREYTNSLRLFMARVTRLEEFLEPNPMFIHNKAHKLLARITIVTNVVQIGPEKIVP